MSPATFSRLLLLSILMMPGGVAQAQVVMLPTQQEFRYHGSVLVPDGGSVYLGGNSRYASGSSQRGPWPGGSARGSAVGSSGLSLSATIIDHQEIDRQLLGGTPEEFLRAQRGRERQAAATKAAAADSAASSNAASSESVEAGKALVRYARRLHAEGEFQRSQTAYGMALPLLTPELRTLANRESQRQSQQ